jgi:hypothetical protein
MQQHGPSDFTGPLRGTSAWWHGTEGRPDEIEAEPVPTKKKGKRMTHGKRRTRKVDGAGPRLELIERVRREIAAGTYDSPERWEAALEQLLSRLGED